MKYEREHTISWMFPRFISPNKTFEERRTNRYFPLNTMSVLYFGVATYFGRFQSKSGGLSVQ